MSPHQLLAVLLLSPLNWANLLLHWPPCTALITAYGVSHKALPPCLGASWAALGMSCKIREQAANDVNLTGIEGSIADDSTFGILHAADCQNAQGLMAKSALSVLCRIGNFGHTTDAA